MTKNPWTIIDQESVYENEWIELLHHNVLNPSGGKGIYGKVHFKNLAIGIIPLDENMNTWIVGQYRFPLNRYSWEIPEGGGSLGTEPQVSAERELKEEVGLIAKRYKKILTMHLSNSVSDEYGIVYLARDLQQGIATPEESEDLVVKKITFSKVFEMVMNEEITDSLSVAGILKLKLLIDKGEI